MRRILSLLAISTVLIAIVISFIWIRAQTEPATVPVRSQKNDPSLPARREEMSVESPIRFTLVPRVESAVDFEYYGNPSDEHYMTEQNGGGVALFDADADGRLDIFLVNGSHFQKPAESVGASNRLFRQTGDWRFDDVTVPAGLQAFGFGQGCAAGDYDNDGFCDLFVANYGTNRLWHNNGDGTFTEVMRDSIAGNNHWSSSAAFADLDGDGNPELYVVNYVDWTPERITGKRIPSPMDFAGLPDHLYWNTGDGTFQEVGMNAGIAIANEGKGLAVAIVDVDGDRLPDIYVANDTTRNFLFHNLGGLKFEEIAVPSGCAVSQNGAIGSSMGISIGDYNRDGWADLFVTNFAEEMLDAFTGIGPAGFVANNTELGIDLPARRKLKFGIVLADFDSDGWPDLFFANGHLWDETAAGGAYKMQPNLLRNSGGSRFIDVSLTAGDYFQQRWLGRAVACGDLDNDGDADLIVSHLLDPPAILRNDTNRTGRVLRLKLIGTRAARQGLGTRVEAVTNGRSFVAHVLSGESFQASHDDRVLIPVGDAAMVEEVRVHWSPDHIEIWKNVPSEELVWLRQGTTTVKEDLPRHTRP